MMKKKLIILVFLAFSASMCANMLLNFYHANHGPVERLVFVFNEYPRYRLRDDILDVNLSFLDCRRNPSIQTEVFEKKDVVSRITFVETDAFIGVLISSYDGYGLDHFILNTEDGYKLVMDVFRYREPPTATMARDYADFYDKVGLAEKSAHFNRMADSLQAEWEASILLELEMPESTMVQDTEEIITDTSVAPVKLTEPENQTPEKPVERTGDSPYKKLNQKLPDILRDIYEDKMLMFSIIVVVAVILIMLLMSVIRRFHKSRPAEQMKPSDNFGTEEFQRVTIKRLLSNGWQVEEIARELNISVKEVEEFGRGN
ncbi:MAG: hypothetical protein K9N06_06535 [Candidatus Cloacimonetes bacterium]|nr:hypothetical protein [Candidatus Cloacimonadota bacterium]